MKALVVGGGIGGLTAGIALRRAGIEVELYERAPAIGEVGAGISLWPNAIRALDAIGVGAAVRALGCSQGDGAVRTWRGRRMLALSMAEIERATGGPVVMLHRAALIDALRQGFGDRGLNLGAELVDFEQDERGVRARFANGQRAEGDVLIGADGWRSAVRRQILPSARSVYVGYTGLRALVDAPTSNGFRVRVVDARPNSVGLLFAGSGRAEVPFVGGTRWVSQPIVRVGIQFLDALGRTEYVVPVASSAIGTTRCYQFWFRDLMQPDGTGAGLTAALEARFGP